MGDSCAGLRPRRPTEHGTFDYDGWLQAGELDPIERALSILSVDVDPEMVTTSARWMDLSRTEGAVTVSDADDRLRAVMLFELSAAGWRVVRMDRCGSS